MFPNELISYIFKLCKHSPLPLVGEGRNPKGSRSEGLYGFSCSRMIFVAADPQVQAVIVSPSRVSIPR